MKKYVSMVSALGLMFVLGGLPLAAFAESRGSATVSGQVGVSGEGVRASGSVSVEADDDDASATRAACTKEAKVCADGSTVGRTGPNCEFAACPGGEDAEGAFEEAREEAKQDRERARESMKDALELVKEGFPFSLNASTTVVFSVEQLKRAIELRKEELEREEENASTTPDVEKVVKNANPVRLAVHTLLASKNLLGGIGPQVSEIAKHMNDSLATTTAAHLTIESRGFLTRLFFGGDRRSAEAISEVVAANQERIQVLTNLLAQASTTPEVKATIEARIAAFEAAQAKLQAAADAEAKAWGFFSWRF